MNLVGKILTMFIFVMSLFFCAFAVAVYATHKNWREVVLNEEAAPGKPLGLAAQLRKEQEDNKRLKLEKDDLEKRLTSEKDAAVQAHTKLDSEYVRLKQEHDQLQQDYNDTDQKCSEALTRMKTTLAELSALRREVEGDEDQGGNVPGLRKEIRQAQSEKDDYREEVTRLTDRLHQVVNEWRSLKDRQLQLATDLAKAKQVLTIHGLQAEPGRYTSTPPPVDGIVQAITRDGLVEVNIGSDDGLVEGQGQKLQVYRHSGGSITYVGRIEVVKTDTDMSVCKVDRAYQQSKILEGDRVTSKANY